MLLNNIAHDMYSEFNLATIHQGIWMPTKKSTHHPLPTIRCKKPLMNREDLYEAILQEYQHHFGQLMQLYFVYDPKPFHNYRRLQLIIPEEATFYLYFETDLPADLCMSLALHPSFSYQSYLIQPTKMSFIRKRTYRSKYDAGSDSRESSPEPQVPEYQSKTPYVTITRRL
jgi:hypothetical protein